MSLIANVTHDSIDLAPQWWSEHAVAEGEIQSLEVMKEAILKRAKPKFGRPIQIAERLHAAKVKLTELNAVMHGFCEIAPLPHQSVHRCLASLLGLFSDLDREIDERRDSDKHRCQLPNCRKHFPVHAINQQQFALGKSHYNHRFLSKNNWWPPGRRMIRG